MYSILFFFMSLFCVKAQETLIKNVNVWDGRSKALTNNVDVLVQDNLIVDISKNLQAPLGATIIDGKNNTLIPGDGDERN